jgi:hypothetical protein
MSKEHPGFKSVAAGIAKQKNPKTGQPYGKRAAGAIAAAAARNASASAKRKNPNLRKVKGK